MDSQSPSPIQGDGGGPNPSLQAKINQMTENAVGADPKSAFVYDIWPTLQDEYEVMKRRLVEFCENTLKEEGIACQVTGRTKAVDSIKASLERREKALNQQRFESLSTIFDEIHDLVGLRIILEFPDDMHRAIDFIKRTFSEKREPAVFRADREVGRHWKPWFGAYQTCNYRLSLKDGKCGTLTQFCDVLFEIQLTTLAESLYNKFAHPLFYKGSSESLTRQDEIVVDMSHGLSLCYTLCLMYMKDKLEKGSDRIQSKDGLLAATTSFHQTLRGTSLNTLATPEDLVAAADIPAEAYKSPGDLKEWIDRRINDILTEVRSTSQTVREAVLSKLPVAEGAAFDSRDEEYNARCHPSTRTELLCQIQEWVNDPQAESIFWLNGMAGTGKSTISRTVAKSFADKGLLGASFFFKRGEGDRGKATLFFPSIACQLVCKIPTLALFVRDAIDADPAVAKKALRDQFEKLILQPLGHVRHVMGIMIVIDALDECDGDNDVKVIISLLARAKELRCPQLRIFITSRPELPIRLGFKDVQGKYQGLALHQIPEQVVERDISTFFRYELAKIRDEYNKASRNPNLPRNWPGENFIHTLTQMAVPLFIFAATACRFIYDGGRSNPDSRLKHVLQYRTETRASRLDKLEATYLPVLSQLTYGRNDRDKAAFLTEFRDVVGPIVLLAQPLSTQSLAEFLNLKTDDVEGRLMCLHSVLDIPSQLDAPVRLFHLSFRDFLVDQDEPTKNEFWIDATKYHGTLADRCIKVMRQYLKRDICNLQVPGMLRSEVDQRTLDAGLPPFVQYACQYWVQHLKESKSSLQDGDPVHSFLRSHLLYWLEVLGLLGRISESIGMVDDLLTLLPADAIKISEFLRDIRRFVQSSCLIIDIAPLQIYASALVFSPVRSITRGLFKQEEQRWITSELAVEDDWNACMQTLEGHGHSVWSVAFSPDSKLIVSGSADKTIKIWDVATGVYTQTLEGHGHSVWSVAFSPDSKLVVSGSEDKTIKIWDVATGVCTQTLEGHGDLVSSVAFSPNSKLVVSGSEDKTIKIWDVATGVYTQTLEGHGRLVWSIAFSPNSKLVVSGSEDKTIKIWDVATGVCTQTLEGHGDLVSSVAFSPNSKLVVSGSEDKTIKIWDVATGVYTQTLEGHGRLVWSIAFSPNSKLIVSGSADKTIKIWDVATGVCTQTLEGHGRLVWSIVFSPNSKLIVSGSADIKIWDVATGVCTQTLEGHGHSVWSIAFSPNSKLVVSGSADIKIWDVATGVCTQTLEGHGHSVWSVAFSPDSKLVVSGSADKTIKIWDVATGVCTQTLEGHGHSVWSVAFSPNSKLVVSGSADKIIKIWDVVTGVCTQTFKGHYSTFIASWSGDEKTPLQQTYSIGSDGKWITRGSKNWLWLPPGCRPVCSAVAARTIAIGCSSGKVLIMVFPSDN